MFNLRNLFLAGVAVFVCYHFWPDSTVNAGKSIAKVTTSAVKAGYDTAKK